MRDVNLVVVSGNVGTVKFGVTDGGEDEVCTFTLASQKDEKVVTWVRINVFDAYSVKIARNFLDKGASVLVEGEVMNRYSNNRGDWVTELRCLRLRLMSKVREDRAA